MTQPITGKTKIFGIIGHPVSHSLSPLMQNAAFEALRLPYCYLPFEVPADGLQRAVQAILPLGILGMNVTIPHKEAVIPFLDSLAPEAQAIGAVNTIEVLSGRLIGHNTDGKGFLRSLSEMEVDPSGKRVILLGAGGAAKGVAISLAETGLSEIILINRNLERAKALADRLTSLHPRLKISLLGRNFERSDVRNDTPTLLINATPLGMKEDDPSPFPLSFLDPSWVIADLVYRPDETALLMAARKAGSKIIPGLGMLLYQGALAFEIWTRKKAPIEVMRAALRGGISPH